MRRTGSHGYIPRRTRRNQPLNAPDYIIGSRIFIQCKNHDYYYYKDSWTDDVTGKSYQRGYYDEEGKFYGGDELVFRKPDGSYEAHYTCDYCGSQLDSKWQEGYHPTCQNCGAQMRKEATFIDDIIDIDVSAGPDYVDLSERIQTSALGGRVIRKLMLIPVALFLWVAIFFCATSGRLTDMLMQNRDEDIATTALQEETNLRIYGTEIYLDEISDNIYRICTQEDDYEKRITWDYGAESYYDPASDCYLWYNTQVSPNLWQYWYDDIAGSNYYGWMECEGDTWYIEVSDTQWEEYTSDTSALWHIENEFDY